MSDTEISILDRCTGRQLRELLALASTGAKSTRDWLLEIGDLERMEWLVAEMCIGAEQPGDGLLPAVCSANTPVEVLVEIKSIAKRLAVTAQGPAQRAAATLLYHLSIASALGRHGQNISSREPTERLPLYKDLAAELPDEQLAAIFERAVASLPPA
jgi:hypothetical protein